MPSSDIPVCVNLQAERTVCLISVKSLHVRSAMGCDYGMHSAQQRSCNASLARTQHEEHDSGVCVFKIAIKANYHSCLYLKCVQLVIVDATL